MNILHTVESYYPEVSGMAEAVRQISEELVRLGHNVTIATGEIPERKKKIINGVHIVEFNNPQKYQNYLKNSSFDIMTNFAAQQWATDLALPILSRIKAKKVLVPTGFSKLNFPFYRNYFNKMKNYMKQYDMNIFHSKNYRDINFARKNNIRNIKIIPNGASKKEFLGKNVINIRKKLNIPDDHFLVLNVSSHTGLKGHFETIRIFCKARLKKSTLLMIGKHTKSLSSCYWQCRLLKLLSGKNILIKDLNREQTVAAFKTANVFLFTSRVECSPLVLYESLAANTPFLTTDAGNTKEIIKWTGGGKLIPSDTKKSAAILKKYYQNPQKLTVMGKTGHKAWLKRFTWEKIAREYETLYQSLIHD